MRLKQLLCALITVFVILSVNVCAFAMNTDFELSEIESESQESFLRNIDMTLITEEPQKDSIECFDVNDEGMVAIGTRNSTHNTVAIYDKEQKFLYGYSFETQGNFALGWDNKNLIIYSVRSDIAASFDEKGNNVEMKEIKDTIENNTQWHKLLLSTSKTVDGKEYEITNNMGVFNYLQNSYSILTETDGNQTRVLYDVSSEHSISFFVKLIFFVLVVVFSIIYIVRHFREWEIFKKTHG